MSEEGILVYNKSSVGTHLTNKATQARHVLFSQMIDSEFPKLLSWLEQEADLGGSDFHVVFTKKVVINHRIYFQHTSSNGCHVIYDNPRESYIVDRLTAELEEYGIDYELLRDESKIIW